MIVHFNLVILMLIGSLVKPAQAFFAPSLSTSRPRSTILHLSNPFTSMLGDMASSFLGGGGGNVNPTMDATLTTLGPSWETVGPPRKSPQRP